MIYKGVKRCAHSQTQNGSAKEARKDKYIRGGSFFVARMNDVVHVCGRYDGGHRSQEVRPDIDRLIVQIEQRLKRVEVGSADLAVPRANEGVIATPCGQVVPEKEEFGFSLLFERLQGGEDRFCG